MTSVIEINGLRKVYSGVRGGETVAVAGLDLDVPEGGVFGFLGPNGSGKTTTIRCLLGLARPTSGQLKVLGAPTPAGLPHVIARVGAIVETPALFPTMTARENLRLLAAIDKVGKRRVDEMLEFVDLSDRADDKVRKYSLGMRQRLGMAAALLKDPALVILDEPANGLDPAGIRQTRELLRNLAAEGRTVLVSSHQLSEVEQTCDRVAIIDGGRCILQGKVDEVLASAVQPALLVDLCDRAAGAATLRAAGIPVDEMETFLRVGVSRIDAAHVTKLLADQGLYVTEMLPERVSLEDLFLEVTEHERIPA